MILLHPFKSSHPGWLMLGLVMLGAGVWLVFWPPPGISLWVGMGGPLLGFGSALAAVQLALWRRTGLEHAAAPAEVNAWTMLLFLGALIAVALGNADLLATGLSGRGATQLGLKLGGLTLFYVILAHLLRVRRGEEILEDERDLEIKARSAAWGRGALVFCITGLMVMLGFSPAEKLPWATPLVIASQLWFALLWGWLVEYSAVVFFYSRDRSRQ
jgi:hypothetical protein